MFERDERGMHSPRASLIISLAMAAGVILGTPMIWLALSALVWTVMPNPDELTAALGGVALLAAIGVTVLSVQFWRGDSDPRDVQSVDETLLGALLGGPADDPQPPELAVVGAVVVDALAVCFLFLALTEGTEREALLPWVVAAVFGPSLLLALAVMFFQRPRFLLPHELRMRHARKPKARG